MRFSAGAALAVNKSGTEVFVPACPAIVRDTIGVGDAFSADLLSAIAESGLLGRTGPARLRAISPAAMSRLLNRASIVAALACERVGAGSPPRADALRPAESGTAAGKVILSP